MVGAVWATRLAAICGILLLSGCIGAGAPTISDVVSTDPPPPPEVLSFEANEPFVWNTTHATEGLSIEVVVESSSFCMFQSTSAHFATTFGPVHIFMLRQTQPPFEVLGGWAMGLAAYYPDMHVHVLGNVDTRSFGEGDRRSFTLMAGLGGSSVIGGSNPSTMTLTVGLRDIEPYEALGVGSYEVRIECEGAFQVTSLRGAPEAVLFHAASTEGGIGISTPELAATALDQLSTTMEGEETRLLVRSGTGVGLVNVRAPHESYVLPVVPYIVADERGPPGGYTLTLNTIGEGDGFWGGLLGFTPLSTLDEVFRSA